MGALWELLFKYPVVVFERGRLVWAPPVPAWLVAALLAAALGLCAWSYLRGRGERRPRLVLLGLRLGALAVLGFSLLRPTLLLPVAVPQENFLAVVIDDSRSMRIADREGEPRSDFVRSAFAAENSPVLEELAKRFRLRFYRFSDEVERVDGAGALAFGGSRTYLGRALERARDELASVPLAGVVLVTDGADMPTALEGGRESALTGTLTGLRAASVPVFTVGVGREGYERDVEVSRISAPPSVLRGSSVLADVTLSQTGFSGETVRLFVEDEGRVVEQHQVTFARDGSPATVRARLTASLPGARAFRFRVEPLAGERVLENNQRTAHVEVEDRREKILYFEGEPRFEVKFMRRAVAADPQIQLVVLQRTADNKYLRLDVDSAQELETGFPQTREELFAYRGLVLGSVEASYFSDAQLRMIADFVRERGGGLLVLGGRHALAEGGYAGTPLADALPVELDPRTRDTTFFAELRVTPTRAAAGHAVTQLADDPDASARRWAELPALSTFNRVAGLKPGATALLTGSGPALPGGQVVLAHHRYGRGQAMALVVQDSWLWQMHSEVSLEDQTHERFWRQMLRWLVSDVPGQLEVSAPAAAPGEPVRLTARVRDAAYRSVSDAEVVARAEGPDGRSSEVPLQWSVESDGEYRGTLAAPPAGVHRVVTTAHRGGAVLAADTLLLETGAGDEEFFAAQMRAPLLRRIAEQTGGRFFTQAEVARLPEEVSYTGRGVTVTEEREIWDMPILFLLLVALVGAEWGFRRARGLA